MAREMSIVAREKKNIPFVMQVISSQCHRNPVALRNEINKLVSLFKDKMQIFVAYGKCFLHVGTNYLGVYSLEDLNCASILIGGDSEYEKMSAGTYFLTPYLAMHWKEYFLGKKDNSQLDQKSIKRLERWFEPIERIVKINIEPVGESENILAKEFSSVINKPLIYHSGNLEVLRREYNNFFQAF
ncbi:hypothetical protein DCCM_2766 [Desulfocucumis palustris]|uniref:DUF1638 domain-containing protein n=1 Tax=Desulfocucumis palustris TaxID=1898651 RepID=A0A2L2XBZ8_9FIRM|nr:DUF1638 domain-containing protein [Desulfocucumis palustris]GBF33660.1 hypothetical protein DCCM_2766 [Desulfocucumis palustris]